MRIRAVATAIAFTLATAYVLAPPIHYERGMQATRARDWQAARTEFDAANGYADAVPRALDAALKASVVSAAYDRALAATSFWPAYAELERVVQLSPGYKDARDRRDRLHQQLERLVARAEQRVSDGDLAGAITAYGQAGGYEGADEQVARLEGTVTVMELFYEQMSANAAVGQLGVALDLSAQILRTVPAYRDVAAKRAGYLEDLYGRASRSLSSGDTPQAVKLFTTLVAADQGYRDGAVKLAQAQVALRSPKPGGYLFDQVLVHGEWQVTFKGVIVEPDGRLLVSVQWRNDAAAARPAVCSADGAADPHAFLTFADGRKVMPLATACSALPSTSISPGKTYTESATYPALADGTRPFTITWYDLGTTGDIVLVRI